MAKLLEKIGLSWHDLFVVVALLETSWWVMFVFIDGADVIFRMTFVSTNVVYHDFLIVQKCVSAIKLLLTIVCIWFGTIFQGRSVYLRFYMGIGLFIDVSLILAWIFIAIDESWPLNPTNIYGLHYIITFVLLRALVYWTVCSFMREIFVTPFGSSVVGTVNGAVVGIPEMSVNSADNLVFFGKGLGRVLSYYAQETQRAALIALIWDFLWTSSIIITQEMPELLFDVIFIGIFGSLPLAIPTENIIMRIARTLLSAFGIFAVVKKNGLGIKVWLVLYTALAVISMGLFCYFLATIVSDDSSLAIFVFCCVFFASNGAKIAVIFAGLRSFVKVDEGHVGFVNQAYE